MGFYVNSTYLKINLHASRGIYVPLQEVLRIQHQQIHYLEGYDQDKDPS